MQYGKVCKFCRMVRFEHNRLAWSVCADDVVGFVHQLVHEFSFRNCGFVQDFEHHRVVLKFAHGCCHLCPHHEEVCLFGFKLCGVILAFGAVAFVSATTGAIQLGIVVEVHDYGKAVRDGESDIFQNTCKALRVDRVACVVRAVLPADRNSHGIKACCLDNGEICIADGVTPGAIIVTVRFPGVAQVDASSENGVHRSTQGVVHRDCCVLACVFAWVVFWWCIRGTACPECAADSHCRKKFFKHGYPQKLVSSSKYCSQNLYK